MEASDEEVPIPNPLISTTFRGPDQMDSTTPKLLAFLSHKTSRAPFHVCVVSTLWRDCDPSVVLNKEQFYFWRCLSVFFYFQITSTNPILKFPLVKIYTHVFRTLYLPLLQYNTTEYDSNI